MHCVSVCVCEEGDVCRWVCVAAEAKISWIYQVSWSEELYSQRLKLIRVHLMNSASVQAESDGEAEWVSRLSLILSSGECEKAVGDQTWAEGVRL